MENETVTSGDLMRWTGIMAIGIGLAWAVQILGSGSDFVTFSKLVWVVASAAMAGTGVGLIVASGALRRQDDSPVRA